MAVTCPVSKSRAEIVPRQQLLPALLSATQVAKPGRAWWPVESLRVAPSPAVICHSRNFHCLKMLVVELPRAACFGGPPADTDARLFASEESAV